MAPSYAWCKKYTIHVIQIIQYNTFNTYNTELTYTLYLFPVRSENSRFRIFFPSQGAQRRRNTRYATPSAAFSSIYSVYPLPRDRPLTTGKGRCGYSLTVVHFRKVVICRKIGSAGNGHPVI
ncbi:TPA: hypothetical protein MJA66_26560 [Klebsiella pneumoniae]|nr:hypothetical protein [Klebsiella pneumoniae]